jgi:carboxymethylenebutenolidase
MPQRDVEITTEDGICPASLHTPKGSGPWPAVIMYPDAGGLRDVFRSMGDRLAGLGYVTLVPDVYYRAGDWAPFDMGSAFGDEAERARIIAMSRSVSADMAERDARAFIDFLGEQPEASTEGGVGTTGYCMGGRMSLIVAGRLGEPIAAAASFHGGGIAADEPESPHHAADRIKATVYVAGAIEDGSFTDEQKAVLEKALTDAGVQHTIETYPAHHGFAVADNPTHDATAEQRHWDALSELYGGALRH